MTEPMDLMDVMKPVNIKEHETKCMEIAMQFSKVVPMSDAVYSANGLNVKASFEGKEYLVAIVPL